MDAGNCGDNVQPHLNTAHIAQMQNICCMQVSEIWNISLSVTCITIWNITLSFLTCISLIRILRIETPISCMCEKSKSTHAPAPAMQKKPKPPQFSNTR